jgi:exodeoxyribonuclease VII large subunit
MDNTAMRPLWSVSELTSAIKNCLEDEFPSVRVQGEISNCRPSGAGHIYFTLKDSGSVISAVLFRGRAAGSTLKPEDGISVVASGKIDVYPPRGSYQLIVDTLEPAGKGALLEALERRKKALAAEGLFDMERKKSLPPYPRRVAVVTSPTGAAVRDILQVLSRRAAAPRVTILPTPVQGNDAPGKIAEQLARAASYDLGDVVILARGGGSIEDLMCFNDEVVVRAVAACPLPVVSGVGHEIDVTLADLAADVRAATPSAAAELVSDRSEDLLIRARGFRRDAAGLLSVRISADRRTLNRFDPKSLAVLTAGRLEEALRRSDDRRESVMVSARDRLGEVSRRLELAERSLQEASPSAVMARGYARVTLNGKGVVDVEMLKENDLISMKFARGAAESRVTRVISDEEQGART